MDWIDAGPTSELSADTCTHLEIDGTAVLLFNVDGTFHCIEDRCSHDGAAFDDAPANGCEIVCPRHGARFSLVTGEALSPPAYEPIAVFPVRVHEGRVQVRDARWD